MSHRVLAVVVLVVTAMLPIDVPPVAADSEGLADATSIIPNLPVGMAVATEQTVTLRTSKLAGSIPRGTTVTFTATVRPLGPSSTRATVRFVVVKLVDGVWRQASHRDVVTELTGRATLRWTFSTAGSWYVRAKPLADATLAASNWSPVFRYTVRLPGCPDPPYRLVDLARVPVSPSAAQRVACFGHQEVRFGAAVAYKPALTFGGPPGFRSPISFVNGFSAESVVLDGWLADGAIAPRDSSLVLGTEGCPSAGCDEVWWEVSGRFDADAAKLCPAETIEYCRNAFFVDTMWVVRERHRVQRGETLGGIARARGVTLAALIAANPQIRDPNRIHTGDLVRIPRARWADRTTH